MRTKKILLVIITMVVFATIGVLVFVKDTGICLSVSILAVLVYRELTKGVKKFESDEEGWE